jgi:hypothetical protein
MSDPVTEAVRNRLLSDNPCGMADDLISGLLKALDLRPPGRELDDDTGEYDALTAGWWDCHRKFVWTVGRELGVIRDPFQASYDAMPEQMREML